MSKPYEVIIVGGGMSGLACANTLAERGTKNFLIISNAIGGRVLTSEGGDVNYGAFYVRSDYQNVLKYVELKNRIRVRDVTFAYSKVKRAVFSPGNFKHALSFVRLYLYLHIFSYRYRRFRDVLEKTSPEDAFARNRYIRTLYQQPAKQFIENNGLEYWARYFINPIIHGTGFMDIKDISSFYMLLWLLPLIKQTYEFNLNEEALLRNIFKNILRDTVTAATYDGQWQVETEGGKTLTAHKLVLALPIHETKKLVPISEKTNRPVSVYMAHVRGKLRAAYVGDPFFLMSSFIPDIAFVREANGTYLFYSHHSDYDLSRYFLSHEVITKKHWNPAFFIGNHIVKANRGQGLYVIGDHNLCGMEESYITGKYAAHAITASSAE